jgi:nucleoside-diphosphate kinase
VKEELNLERTFFMIKPEAVESGHTGEIIDYLIKNGFSIRRMRHFSFDKSTGERFYSVHRGKDFFEGLIVYITSGPVVGIELEKSNAVSLLRELVGATDPAESRPGTIRYMYGTDLRMNAVHASDSPESAEKELAIAFPEE